MNDMTIRGRPIIGSTLTDRGRLVINGITDDGLLVPTEAGTQYNKTVTAYSSGGAVLASLLSFVRIYTSTVSALGSVARSMTKSIVTTSLVTAQKVMQAGAPVLNTISQIASYLYISWT